MNYQKMRPQQLVDAQKVPLIFVPLGPLEWHGPHLPIGTDGLLAEHIAHRLAEKWNCPVLPTLYVGGSGLLTDVQKASIGLPQEKAICGVDFQPDHVNSLYVRPETLRMLLEDYITGLLRQGYQLIVLVSGHGGVGHTPILEAICKTFSDRAHQVIWIPAVPPLDAEDPNSGHATVLETASMLSSYPETVDCSTLPLQPQALSCAQLGIVDDTFFYDPIHSKPTVQADPRTASVQQGQQYIDHALSMHAQVICNALQKIKDSV